MKPLAKLRDGLILEWIFAAVILVSIGHTVWHLFTFKYLPPPFFYEPSDIYADWFNTSYWAHTDGAFDVWTTLYPPLSFVILQFLSIDECYPRSRAFEASPGLAARDCDWVGLLSIWSFWLLSVVLIFLALRKFDSRRAIPRTICVGLGWPLLNAIERGNLLLIALPCFILAVMPILKSTRWRWVFAGLAVNLKVYLIAPFLAQLVVRRWRWVEGVLLATVLTYLLSYAWFGHGTLLEIVRNLTAWSTVNIANPLDFWPATTFQGLVSLMESEAQIFPTLLVLGSREISIVQLVAAVLLRSTQAIVVLALVAACLRPEVVTRYRIYSLGLLFALITTEAGGYTPALWMVLVMTERWRGFGPIFAICGSYLLACSYDIGISNLASVVRYSYLFDADVIVEMNLTVWPLFRPLLIIMIAVALASSTLRSVWLDIRHQGWSGRWRYRGDSPLLPWVRMPRPPGEA